MWCWITTLLVCRVQQTDPRADVHHHQPVHRPELVRVHRDYHVHRAHLQGGQDRAGRVPSNHRAGVRAG